MLSWPVTLPKVSMNQAESRPLNLENEVFKAFVIILGQATKASDHVPTSSHDIHFIIMYVNVYLGLHHGLAWFGGTSWYVCKMLAYSGTSIYGIAHRFWQELCPANTLNSGLDMIINFVPPWCDCKKNSSWQIYGSKSNISPIYLYIQYIFTYIFICLCTHIYYIRIGTFPFLSSSCVIILQPATLPQTNPTHTLENLHLHLPPSPPGWVRSRQSRVLFGLLSGRFELVGWCSTVFGVSTEISDVLLKICF